MRRSLLLPLLLIAVSAMGQQDQFKWRIAAHTGIDRSLSDIESSYAEINWERSRNFGFELSKTLGYGVSLGLGVENAQLSGYDVLTGRKDRALNFLSKLNTAQLELAFRMDNGKLLKYDARFAPFITVGVGVGKYNVFGDLYSASGSRYYYWDDGTIRDQAEGGSNAAIANEITTDGDFETRLSKLATEANKPSDRNFIFIPARIGLKWRICDRMAAELYYGFNWTFTDWIDDVHDAYPARATGLLAYISNPTGRSGQRGDPGTDDKYQSIGINVAYYFGRRSTSYRMTPVYVDDRSLPPPPPPFVPLAPKPAPKAVSAPVTKNVVINVEHITVGSFTVDSLVVGTLVQRARTSVDTTKQYSIRKAKLDSLLANDSIRMASGMDSLEVLRTTKPDSLRAPLKLDTLTLLQSDTLQPLELDSLHLNKLDSLRAPLDQDTTTMLLNDTLHRSGSDTVRAAKLDSMRDQVKRDTVLTVPADTLERQRTDSIGRTVPKSRIVPVPVIPSVPDTVYRNAPDSLGQGGTKRSPAGDQVVTTVATPAPVIIHDTVRVPEKQVGDGRVDTVYVDRPVTETRFQQQPAIIVQQPAYPQQEVRTRDRTVPIPVPVIVTKKETVKEMVQYPALQDSLRKMQVENERLRNVADSLRTIKTGGSAMGTAAMPPGIRAEDYAGILTDLQADRIATLERYIQVMDNTTATGKTDSLKQRIAEMDKELKALKSSQKSSKDSTGNAVFTGMEKTMLDTVVFATGSSSVGNAARVQLLKSGKRLVAAKVEHILITGQTDRSGNAALNLRLSQQRADAVKRVLVEAGVPIGAITAKGLGQKLAQHDNDASERVVVVQAVMP
ncbi:MAG: OmpA family protein [Flavobacteriales bacterium]|nr:OmpA family protein [Flavobacteriales bacterium]